MPEATSHADLPPLDRASFERELRAAYPTLEVVAASLVGRSDAQDVVQEATIIAMRKLSDYSPGSNFRAWMSAIVRGTASNHRRSERRRRERTKRAAHTVGREADTTESARVSDEQLHTTLDQLTEDQRCCLLLRIVLEHSYQEIGTILGIPHATARSHVFRARTQMLGLLTQEGTLDG